MLDWTMEEDQEVKHRCKFCSKCFPCGRSLGGHMRSHLINISSRNQKTDENLPKKKLPPLTNTKNDVKTDETIVKKKRKSSKPSEEDTLLQEKLCKECGKTFQSWQALFGHMKCHSVITNSSEQESWKSSSDQQNLIMMDSQSDSESTTPFCKRKRSNRMKRYSSTTSSSLKFLPEVDQQEQEEVALSLIMLSKNVVTWDGMNSPVELPDSNSESLEAKKIGKTLDKNSKGHMGECLKFKKLRNGKLENIISEVKQSEFRPPAIPRNGFKISKLEHPSDEMLMNKMSTFNNLDYEVNSPKNSINKSGGDQFESGFKKNKSSNRKCIDSYDLKLAYGPLNSQLSQDFDKTRFVCTICKKAFHSYQALGGHRASHKKFKGCCASTKENVMETRNLPDQSAKTKLINCKSSENLSVFAAKVEEEIVLKKNKEHECPICFKLFASGQALGGHKRSHFVGDQAKSTNSSVVIQQQIPEIRNFIDLNLPAPDEEECYVFKPWWIGKSHDRDHNHNHNQDHEPLLGLIS